MSESANPLAGPSNFIRDIIKEDLKTGELAGRDHTLIPPEPNASLNL